MAAYCSSYPFVLTSSVDEARALRKTIIITKELGFSNVLLKGDCLPVVLAVTNRLPIHDALCSIVFDIHKLLESELNWRVVHVSRDLTRGADILANFLVLIC